MEEEEEDYMSDKFVSETAVGDANSRASRKRRGHDDRGPSRRGAGGGDLSAGPRKRERKKIEEDMREKGLSTPLTDSNKGFSMLHKMGYTPGMGLGKQGMGMRPKK